MIGFLKGKLLEVRLNVLLLEVHGIGYEVIVSPTQALTLNPGDEVELYTSLVIRDESWTLYGFQSQDERLVFQELQSVSGVGPKVAASILSVHSPGEIRAAISRADHQLLEHIPGIGKKVASRMILELQERYANSESTPSNHLLAGWRKQLVSAITGLGYSRKEAEQALNSVVKNRVDVPEDEELPEILRLILIEIRQG
jgi:Holliday junction DNA helicase RuvA